MSELRDRWECQRGTGSHQRKRPSLARLPIGFRLLLISDGQKRLDERRDLTYEADTVRDLFLVCHHSPASRCPWVAFGCASRPREALEMVRSASRTPPRSPLRSDAAISLCLAASSRSCFSTRRDAAQKRDPLRSPGLRPSSHLAIRSTSESRSAAVPGECCRCAVRSGWR